MELLNGAKLSTDAAAKSTHLKQLAELVIRKDPSLLGEFLEPLLELQVDPAVAVRKTLVSLCEEIATGNPQHLARCIATLRALLKDAAPAVVKQAAKASGPVFREALIEAATKGEGPRVPKEVTDMWTAAKALKDDVRRLVLADRVNDGVRMQAVKFLELAVVLFHGREWGAGIVRDGHATVSLDALATEADDLMGVLLECLKPETCATQAGTVTLVMIGAATSVMGKLPTYTDFALPALLELAAANVAGDAGDAKSAATASMAKELRSTLLNALKSSSERGEIAEYKSELVTALQELGATEEVDAWRRQEERAAQKRKERENRLEQERVKRQRVGAGGVVGRGFELAPDEIEIETATPPDLMRQVLSTIGTLAENDRAMLHAFVTQLAPDVLADVVLSQLANTDSVPRRTMIDVEAGAGRGVETFVLDAMAAHERGDHGASGSNKPRALTDRERLVMGAGDSDGDLAHLVADDADVEMEAHEEADRGRSGSKKGSKGKKGSKAAAAAANEPLVIKCSALTAEQVRHHGKGALTRIVQAADPGGPVARMGGLRLQNVLLTRLASAAVAAAASREGPAAVGAMGGAALHHGTGGVAETASSAALIAGAQTPSAGVLEYLVSAMPDRGAALAATRLLGAVFVNQTLGLMGTTSDGGEEDAEDKASAKDKASKASHRVGPYARTLMTLAVGLIDSQTPARREHFTRLLLDAPAIPPPAIALLRATCALPPQGPEREIDAVKREGDAMDVDADVDAGVDADVDAWGFGASADGETFSWAGAPLPKSPESLSVALETVRSLIEHRPVVRAQCLEIALECAVSPNEDVRTRAVRLVSQRLHGVKTLAAGIEAFALHHLDEASAEGKRALASASRLAEKASESLSRAKEKKAKAEKERAIEAAKLKAEAEGRTYKPGDEDGPAGTKSVTEEDARKKEEEEAAEEAAARERMTSVAVGDAVRATARHVALFCALCNRNNSLLPRLFDFYAKLPEILRPAVVEGVAFDSLVRHVGPACDALVAAIAQPPSGAETLVRRAVEVLADMSEYSEAEAQALAAAALEAGEEAKPPPPKQAPAALIAAVEKLAAANGDDVTYLVPLLGSFDAKRVKALMPRLVGSAPEIFSAALDRLTASIPPKPLTAPEIIVALHDVDPARDGVPLKRIIDACGACFERPDVFPAEALAAALQKMVEFTPLPLLFMRTVIQAETAAPTLREFTLGLLRTLARRQVWRMDPKIWEGFARCAKRSAPRSFPLLCELPPSALGEMLGKFPAMRQPLLAYASAPAVQSGISRAIMAVLQEDKQQQG